MYKLVMMTYVYVSERLKKLMPQKLSYWHLKYIFSFQNVDPSVRFVEAHFNKLI